MPNPYYTFPPDAPLNSTTYSHNRSDKSPPPRPRLPPRRRRGITHPLPDWVESPFSDPWAYTDPQSRCTLYTDLPPEIRFLIFEALLSNRVLHVKMLHDRGYKVLKACRQTSVRWERKFWDTIIGNYGGNTTVACQCGHGSEDSLCLEILRTCRRIYSECIPLLYTRNTFNFSIYEDSSVLVSTPLQKRFQCVTSLELNISHRSSYRPNLVSQAIYENLLARFSSPPPMKVIRLRINELPHISDAQQGLSLQEFWLAPIDKMVRNMASTLEELEFVIPELCFELLFGRDNKAGAIGGKEVEIYCNELRGGKRCRRRLEGLRPGVQYWISCPAEPGWDEI
ncbi:hypothetical protein EMCG_07879 [[Emmonsia] crescens]|uniref:DUF7730 domain-containing protein n=1 Tax=[Emmonsia] crescens TaxID=73230 RepID=A0A0G2JAV2_9EURO|nr:hypothetical protein EMCG_07879 [Emmonsia crescens UAMH 3008]